MQVFAQEQRVCRHHVARAVLGFNLDARQDGRVQIGLGRFAERVVRVHMEVGVFCMHFELPKVPVEGHHLAAPVASAEEPAGNHTVLHLREVDELLVKRRSGHVHVHAPLHRVLVEVEEPLGRLEVFGEFTHGFQLVFAALFGAIDLGCISFLSLLFLPFLGQSVGGCQTQQGRGKEASREAFRSNHGNKLPRLAAHSGLT